MGLGKKTKPGRLIIRFVLGGAFLVLYCFALSTPALALSSVNVPINHWSYDAIDKLQGFGLVNSAIHNTKPYTRIEMARLVKEALNSERYKDKKLPPLINYFLEKLQREYKAELDEVSEASARKTFIKPLQEAEARYAFVSGEPRRFIGFPQSGSQINATEGTPLLPNNEGIAYTANHNFSLQFSSSARFFGIVSAYVEPIFIARENKSNPDGQNDFEADLHKGYAKISAWNIEIEAGRDTMWWGQGYHGTLLLTNNAEPFDMVKISNPTPIILPWYFSYLGLMKHTLFFARLEEDRDFANPWLVGTHIAFKPHPIFEFGATATALVGGSGRPFSLFDRDVSDILTSVDARLRLPFLGNAELYAEFGGEDKAGGKWYEFLFSDVAYIIGIYFPKILPDGRTDFRVEYANNAFRDATDNRIFWYGHNIYTSGYTFEKQVIGHHMEGDSDDLFVRATHYITDKLRAGIDYDYMERGKTLGFAVERIHSVGTDLTYDFNTWLSLSGRYAYGSISNFDMVSGDDRFDHRHLPYRTSIW